jgi:2-polyprenyl-6-methoxyphenol hydroxylase-like FAD-dependent oxidoreductase
LLSATECLIWSRHGYPILFFERSELLEILYDHLPTKDKVFTSHEVVMIESDDFGATVTTKNGKQFEGDMIVGADGINSTVRRSLWKSIESKDPLAAHKAGSCKLHLQSRNI